MSEVYKLINDDCLVALGYLEENSIDSIVTDPPYGLTTITKRFGKDGSAPAKYGKDGSSARLSKGFMGKEWDGSGIEYNVELWKKCLRVLKPGGYLLAFGGTRTYHRIACAIEDAGFEIRDCVMWVYGSGFPKSMNIGLAIDKKLGRKSRVVGIGKSGAASTHTRTMHSQTKDGKDSFGGEFEIKEAQNEWNGWGTALKPAYEPIIVARKPFKGSLVDNILDNEVGGINIDECRVGNEKISIHNAPKGTFAGGEPGRGSDTNSYRDGTGRFPANLILSYNKEWEQEVIGGFPQTAPTKPHGGDGKPLDTREQGWGFKRMPSTLEDNGGSAARYFYCAKASRRDRDEGLEEFEGKTELRNTHPTVKPTSLMQYLVRLVTPKGGTILDPFMGSGSTGKAVMYENKDRDAGYKFIGIEREEEYIKIAKARIEYARTKGE